MGRWECLAPITMVPGTLSKVLDYPQTGKSLLFARAAQTKLHKGRGQHDTDALTHCPLAQIPSAT